MPSMTCDLPHSLCQKKKTIFIAVLILLFIQQSAKLHRHGSGMSTTFMKNRQAVLNDIDYIEHWPKVFKFNPKHGVQLIRNDLMFKVAIGLAITSKGLETGGQSFVTSVRKLQFFQTLLPSFCKTLTKINIAQYTYSFYIAFDKDDTYFGSSQVKKVFLDLFIKYVHDFCFKGIKLNLTFIHCTHNNKPAWAQNDAMMQAYIDHSDYYYRINDDTTMHSKDWTGMMIGQLEAFSPPNVGVVGPNHLGGNTKILTYDFVHRTHIDIFGFYYPRTFLDLYGDTWISKVYGMNRTRKMSNVILTHTQAAGKRYDESTGGARQLRFMEGQLTHDRKTILRFLLSKSENNVTQPTGRRVVTIFLELGSPSTVFGAIKHLILLQNQYSSWSFRQYYPVDKVSNSSVMWQFVSKLQSLGVDVVFTNKKFLKTAHRFYLNYLVIEDLSVDIFLISNLMLEKQLYHLNQIMSWLNSESKTHPLYCVESINGKDTSGLDGIVGFHMKNLRSMKIPITMSSLLKYFENKLPSGCSSKSVSQGQLSFDINKYCHFSSIKT